LKLFIERQFFDNECHAPHRIALPQGHPKEERERHREHIRQLLKACACAKTRTTEDAEGQLTFPRPADEIREDSTADDYQKKT